MEGVEMTKPTKRKKRGKPAIILLSPASIIVFIVGWILSWMGQLRLPKAKQLHKPIFKTPPKQEEVK